MNEVLAIIPARGGSKGLPNKNILPLMEVPLIAYSIKAAQESQHITRVIVSTDSAQIAEIALQYGAEVPFIRPDEYAQDLSTDLEVFAHALNWLQTNESYRPEIVVQLRPTSPIRKVSIIDECIAKLKKSDADSLRIVTESPLTPYKMWSVNSCEETMKPLLQTDAIAEPFNQPRQILPKVYWQIGFLDVIKVDTINQKNSISGNNILPYVVGSEFAIDIDDITSFEKAEEALRKDNELIHFE